jgi:hypothetical protein
MTAFVGKLILFAGLCAFCSLTTQAQTSGNPSVPSRIEVHALPTQTLNGDEFFIHSLFNAHLY